MKANTHCHKCSPDGSMSQYNVPTDPPHETPVNSPAETPVNSLQDGAPDGSTAEDIKPFKPSSNPAAAPFTSSLRTPLLQSLV